MQTLEYNKEIGQITLNEYNEGFFAKNGADRTPMPVEFGHRCRFYSDSDAGEHPDTLE